jgi:hypothetical protein
VHADQQWLHAEPGSLRPAPTPASSLSVESESPKSRVRRDQNRVRQVTCSRQLMFSSTDSLSRALNSRHPGALSALEIGLASAGDKDRPPEAELGPASAEAGNVHGRWSWMHVMCRHVWCQTSASAVNRSGTGTGTATGTGRDVQERTGTYREAQPCASCLTLAAWRPRMNWKRWMEWCSAEVTDACAWC